MKKLETILSEVFRDPIGHKLCADIIHSHSTNKGDIRELALKDLALHESNLIIDLACAYGFFTMGLCNKISAETSLIGIDRFKEYQNVYLNICKSCGFNGRFFDSGIDYLNTMKQSSVDVMLCSFAMYFFPDALSKIVRVLSSKSKFIVITHSSSHLKELINLIQDVYKKNKFQYFSKLPHDRLIKNFSDENGEGLLKKYFNTINKKNYTNKLVFTRSSLDRLLKYIHFKKTFFIPNSTENPDLVLKKINKEISDYFLTNQEFRITKNDVIFICQDPIKN